MWQIEPGASAVSVPKIYRGFDQWNQQGYSEWVEPALGTHFRIHFSCQVEYTAGDGGVWDVSFNGDQVDSISMDTSWKSRPAFIVVAGWMTSAAGRGVLFRVLSRVR